MAIKINPEICDGCPDYNEGRCERICPGNLIEKENEKAKMKRPEECWDCAACVKACPQNAITLYLPEEIGGKGTELRVQEREDELLWIFANKEKKKKVFTCTRYK